MIDATPAPDARQALQAEVDAMTIRFNERASEGSFCERRGLHDHHERMLRQARGRLAEALSASPGRKNMTSSITAQPSEAGRSETDELLERYGIVRLPAENFEYRGYRYSNIKDAIAEAVRREGRS